MCSVALFSLEVETRGIIHVGDFSRNELLTLIAHIFCFCRRTTLSAGPLTTLLDW